MQLAREICDEAWKRSDRSRRCQLRRLQRLHELDLLAWTEAITKVMRILKQARRWLDRRSPQLDMDQDGDESTADQAHALARQRASHPSAEADPAVQARRLPDTRAFEWASRWVQDIGPGIEVDALDEWLRWCIPYVLSQFQGCVFNGVYGGFASLACREDDARELCQQTRHSSEAGWLRYLRHLPGPAGRQRQQAILRNNPEQANLSPWVASRASDHDVGQAAVEWSRSR